MSLTSNYYYYSVNLFNAEDLQDTQYLLKKSQDDSRLSANEKFLLRKLFNFKKFELATQN